MISSCEMRRWQTQRTSIKPVDISHRPTPCPSTERRSAGGFARHVDITKEICDLTIGPRRNGHTSSCCSLLLHAQKSYLHFMVK